MKKSMLVLLAVGLAASAASADVFYVYSDVKDYTIQMNYNSGVVSLLNDDNTKLVTGQSGSNRGGNAVVIFALPVLPVDHGIVSASLSAQAYGSPSGQTADGPFGVDVWGIGFYTSTDPVLSYLDGDTGLATETKVIDDFFMENYSDKPTFSSSTTALAEYINSFYAANPGYAGGTYVFLRLNPDKHPIFDATSANGPSLKSADYGVGTTNEPLLTLESGVVPEPATIALLALGGIGALLRRRTA